MDTLRKIAHARSGDKGTHANIGVIARSEAAYTYLKINLTEDLLLKYFSPLGPSKIVRYEVPNLLAFNFVLHDILDGGGSQSLRLDAQGKSLGQALLELPMNLPKDL